jgi:hypothetical protein
MTQPNRERRTGEFRTAAKQYWPNPAPNWYEGHDSFGVNHAGSEVGAVGRSGRPVGRISDLRPARESRKRAATVTIDFLRENGGAIVTRVFTVPPRNRINVAIAGAGSDVPELADENFGAIITSNQPIAAERSMYSNAIGQIWAAGTNATATALP